jgi:flagellar biosynthesis/type III secretory pathway chaperone
VSQVLQNLEDNLKRQVALYQQLNDLEKDKQKALVENNLKEIETITFKEEKLVFEANHLERERLLWAKQIGSELGKRAEDLTLAELAEHYPVLEGVRKDLDDVVDHLQNIHRTNTQLLQQAIKIVDLTVGMLTQHEKSTYTHPSQQESQGIGKLHLLDRRI